MDKKGVIELETVKAVILILLVVAVFIISLFAVLSNTIPTIKDVATIYDATGTSVTQLKINLSNVSGATLTTCNNDADLGGKIIRITSLKNDSGGEEISSGNYTYTGCNIKGTATSPYSNRLANITYVYAVKEDMARIKSIESNITSGNVSLMKNIPTLMAILGVLILVAGIFIIIIYIRRFSMSEGGGGL